MFNVEVSLPGIVETYYVKHQQVERGEIFCQDVLGQTWAESEGVIYSCWKYFTWNLCGRRVTPWQNRKGGLRLTDSSFFCDSLVRKRIENKFYECVFRARPSASNTETNVHLLVSGIGPLLAYSSRQIKKAEEISTNCAYQCRCLNWKKRCFRFTSLCIYIPNLLVFGYSTVQLVRVAFICIL